MDLDFSNIVVKTEELEVIDVDPGNEDGVEDTCLAVEHSFTIFDEVITVPITVDLVPSIHDLVDSSLAEYKLKEIKKEPSEDQLEACDDSLEDSTLFEEDFQNETFCKVASEKELSKNKLDEPNFNEDYLLESNGNDDLNNTSVEEDLTGKSSEYNLGSGEKFCKESVPEVTSDNSQDVRAECFMPKISSKSESSRESSASFTSFKKTKQSVSKRLKRLRSKDFSSHKKGLSKSYKFHRFIKKTGMVNTNLKRKMKMEQVTKHSKEKRKSNSRRNKPTSKGLKIENVRSSEDVVIKVEENDIASMIDSLDEGEMKLEKQTEDASTTCNGNSNGELNIKKSDPDDVYEYSCYSCGFSCGNKQQLSKHITLTHNKKPEKQYECRYCDVKIMGYPNLRNHMKNKHEAQPELHCPHCEFKGHNPRSLKNHMLGHSGKTCYQCGYCQYNHSRRSGIAQHITHAHIDMDTTRDASVENIIYKLGRSNRKRNYDSLSVRTDSSLSRCDDSNDTENGSDKPSIDIKAIANLLEKKGITGRKKTKSYSQDDLTGSEFSDVSLETMSVLSDISVKSKTVIKETSPLPTAHVDVDYNSHSTATTSSSEVDPLQVILPSDVKLESVNVSLNGCTSLNSFQSSDSPGKSAKKYKHKCSFRKCSFSSNTLLDMEAHVAKIHVKKPCRCDFCDYSTERMSCLKRHILLVHIKERPYQCTMCDLRCGSKSNLYSHMLIHTDQRPFACDECDFRTRTQQDLKLHKNRHRGLKKFSCEYCAFKCDTKSYIKAHMFQHTGETKFICDVCGYKAARNQTLQKHMKKHF